uniref:hypothetical protein n=1 Tax=Pararhizobium sp. IMCC3301 TaxID=3067904 RepID=UPI002740F458|nr:hypothetical protein [Pararhizobium sp. IMCC3301]
MEITFAVMLLLGCADDTSVCEAAQEVAPKYVSIEACEQDIENKFLQDTRFPTLMAQCLAVPASQDAGPVAIDWQVTDDGRLLANVVDSQRQYAGLKAETATD